MLNIPDAVKALYQTDNVRKNFRVTFPDGERADICNGEIVRESVRFGESLCSRSVFRFGLCEASSVEFETVGVGNYYGATIRCALEIDTSSLSAAQLAEISAGSWDGELVSIADSDIGFGFFRIPLGGFRVESCPRNHEALSHRRFVAYTPDFGRRSSTQPGLPSVNVYDKIKVDPALFFAQITGAGLITIDNKVAGRRAPGKLYDRSGTAYELRFYNGNGSIQRYPDVLAQPGDNAAFFRVDGLAYDKTAYYQVGLDVAAALSEYTGADIRCDYQGNQIYSDVLSALKDVYPYIFAPSLLAIPQWFSGLGWFEDNPVFSWPVENGKRYPIMQLYGDWGYSGGEIWPSGRSTGELVDMLEYKIELFSGNLAQMASLVNATTEEKVWVHSLDHEYPVVTYPDTFVSERLAQDSGYRVVIESTGDAAPLSATSSRSTLVPRYSYAGAVAASDMVNGWLELQAAFGKVERTGDYTVKRLSADSPAAITPGNTRQAWWDEIDVAPIGTVRFAFRADNEEQTIEYVFGPGASVYDMSDNALLKSVDLPSAEDVIALLDAQFVPRLGTVGFTPVELSARGLPWIEDGDALSISAQDGSVVHSYALRRELSGVQILTDSIASEGGNLKEES